MKKPNFDMDFFLQVSKGIMTPEELNETLLELVDKGLIEQYTNKDGDFEFELTDFGREVAETMNKLNKKCKQSSMANFLLIEMLQFYYPISKIFCHCF